MTYTDEELKIAKKWHETNKYRSDMISDIYSFIEGMRFAKNINIQVDNKQNCPNCGIEHTETDCGGYCTASCLQESEG
jgi:hypothetical protein